MTEPSERPIHTLKAIVRVMRENNLTHVSLNGISVTMMPQPLSPIPPQPAPAKRKAKSNLEAQLDELLNFNDEV